MRIEINLIGHQGLIVAEALELMARKDGEYYENQVPVYCPKGTLIGFHQESGDDHTWRYTSSNGNTLVVTPPGGWDDGLLYFSGRRCVLADHPGVFALLGVLAPGLPQPYRYETTRPDVKWWHHHLEDKNREEEGGKHDRMSL